jgi:hypothetical protein
MKKDFYPSSPYQKTTFEWLKQNVSACSRDERVSALVDIKGVNRGFSDRINSRSQIVFVIEIVKLKTLLPCLMRRLCSVSDHQIALVRLL